jgi:hypothetical protein
MSIIDIAFRRDSLKKVEERGPGRPEMGVKPTVVRLPAGVPERIDAVAGPNKRAEFIREAVEKELKKWERK